jgi:hypothetical protein
MFQGERGSFLTKKRENRRGEGAYFPLSKLTTFKKLNYSKQVLFKIKCRIEPKPHSKQDLVSYLLLTCSLILSAKSPYSSY